jgi:hypothetical protein
VWNCQRLARLDQIGRVFPAFRRRVGIRKYLPEFSSGIDIEENEIALLPGRDPEADFRARDNFPPGDDVKREACGILQLDRKIEGLELIRPDRLADPTHSLIGRSREDRHASLDWLVAGRRLRQILRCRYRRQWTQKGHGCRS